MFREAGMSGQIVSVGKAALQGQGGGGGTLHCLEKWPLLLCCKNTFSNLDKYIFWTLERLNCKVRVGVWNIALLGKLSLCKEVQCTFDTANAAVHCSGKGGECKGSEAEVVANPV